MILPYYMWSADPVEVHVDRTASSSGAGIAPRLNEKLQSMSSHARDSMNPLRVGLLLDSLMQPRWHRKIIEDIVNDPSAELTLVVLRRGGPFFNKFGMSSLRHLLYRITRLIDDFLFIQEHGAALDEVEISDLIQNCPILEVGASPGDQAGSLEIAEALKIAEYDLDVAICLGFEPRWNGDPPIPRHGIWAYRFGNRPQTRQTPLGVREVLEQQPSVDVSLRALGTKPNGEEHILYEAHFKTDPFSIRRHNEHVCWLSAEFVGRTLRLLEEGRQISSTARTADPPDQASVVPGNWEMARMLARFATRIAAEGLRRLLYQDQWILACSPLGGWDDSRPDLSALRRLSPPMDRFWADPFPVKADDKYYIFFEEYDYMRKKAHISVIVVDGDGGRSGPRKALERNYHLSYPFIFMFNNNIYMIPETTVNRTVELYRCVEFPCRWRLDRILLSDVHAADATLVEHDGLWWMFASVRNDREELCLFYAESPLGPWRPHRRNPVKIDVRSARPAGRIFQYGGVWYRPSQNCTLGYGGSMVINRITHWDVDKYEEFEVARILPDWEPGLDRTHTLNTCDALLVIDARIAQLRLKSLWRKSASTFFSPWRRHASSEEAK